MHAIRHHVVVEQDGRIEICDPKLKVGTHAEVIVLEEAPQQKPRPLSRLIGAAKGAFATPEEADAFIRRERDSWE